MALLCGVAVFSFFIVVFSHEVLAVEAHQQKHAHRQASIGEVIYLRDEINGLFIREGFYVKIGGVSKDVFENFVEEVFVFHLKVAHDVFDEILIDVVI